METRKADNLTFRHVEDTGRLSTLRWYDIPEPTGPIPVTYMQRKTLEIQEPNIDNMLIDNNNMRYVLNPPLLSRY